MLEAVQKTIEVITPVLVATVTGFSAVLVARVDKIRKDIRTNHGSKNIGDAVDRLTVKVDNIADNQEKLILTVNSMQKLDRALESRLDAMDAAKVRIYRHIGLSETGPFTIFNRFKRRRK